MTRRWRSRRAAAVFGAALIVVAALLTGASVTWQPTYSVFSAKTTNAANYLATAARFRCKDRVAADSPLDQWLLSESSGTSAVDQVGTRPGTYSSSGITYKDSGPCPADQGTGIDLSGGASVGMTTAVAIDPSTLGSFSEEIAFKSTSTSGGVLMGLWASSASATGTRDRVIAMSTSGQLVFGMLDSSTGNGVSAASSASYNDGSWHLADAVYSSAGGMKLYVDGSQVATAAGPGAAYTATSMYWRIGYGDVSLAGWVPSGSSAPAAAFVGGLADAAVWGSALSTTQITNHWQTQAAAQNYAEGRTSSQSSTGYGGVASRANDGNTDGVYNDGSVMNTNTENTPWWQVDLANTVTITSIRIWNRTDCCTSRLSDYWVFASNSTFNTSLTPSQQAAATGVWSSHQTSTPSPSTTITLPSTTARYVMVQSSQSAVQLNIAEVQVYGSAN